MYKNNKNNKVLVLNIAGLGYDFFLKNNNYLDFYGIPVRKMDSIFPALTCPVQATFRTGLLPTQHGIVANGFFNYDLFKPLFWEQNAALAEVDFFWNKKDMNFSTASIFWQQSLDKKTNFILTPKPIHKHHGGMIQDCYSRPTNMYEDITKQYNSFNLMHYWGPLASHKSSQWISKATQYVLETYMPNLLLTYIPHLDYTLQKYGTESSKSKYALYDLCEILKDLISTARNRGYKIIFFGDYAINNVSKPIFPNKILFENGFFKCRNIKGMLYPDFYSSKAFVVVDHQIAHLHIFDKQLIPELTFLFTNLKGVANVVNNNSNCEFAINHTRAGTITLIAEKNAWFSYKWWRKTSNAPDYASHVDIHNKPGYDPCELFFGWNPFVISQNDNKVKGSHGIVSKDTSIAWGTDIQLSDTPENICDLSFLLQGILQ